MVRQMGGESGQRLERLSGMLKRRGFILPAYEIHGGSKGLYDFGPNGGRPVSYTHLTLPTSAIV